VTESDPAANASMRVILSKMTAGGSNVETMVATGDQGAEISGSAISFTMTPPVAVAIAENERLIARLYVIPAPSLTLGGGFTVNVNFGTSTNDTWLELTETVTFKANGTLLVPRRTSDVGIGNFFDMLTTRGASTSTTGVVNTVASGTLIQWTRTAGGTVLEWISGRCANGWRFTAPSQANTFAVVLKASLVESAAQANVTGFFRIYRYRNGVEDLCAEYNQLVELTTTNTRYTVNIGTAGFTTVLNTVEFAIDDRVILRAYIANADGTTMGGSRTATISYDHNADALGDTSMILYASVDFKAESDPSLSSRVPSGLTMGGVGN
jgi:hypothetical protein